MTVKIFLPEKLFVIKQNCNLYGEIKIGEQNCVSYYVISAVPNKKPANDDELLDYERSVVYSNELRYLGHIVNATDSSQLHSKDVAIAFMYDDKTPNIYLSKLSIKTVDKAKVNVFLYNEHRILKLQDLNENIVRTRRGSVDESENSANEDTEKDKSHEDDLYMLHQLLLAKEKFRIAMEGNDIDYVFKRCALYVIKFPFEILLLAFHFIMTRPPFVFIFRYTFLSDFYKEWLKFKKSGYVFVFNVTSNFFL